jgi:protein associated with RNAse G/E
MYTIVKKQYPNTTIWQYTAQPVVEHPEYIICKTSSNTPVVTPQGNRLFELGNGLIYLSAQDYSMVFYRRNPEETMTLHLATPFWKTGQTIQYVDYELVIHATDRSLELDDIDLWRSLQRRLPEQEAELVLACLSRTVVQLAQDRFPPLDILRDVSRRWA